MLSIVIPAFNEAHRLPRYLERIQQYLSSQQHELIVVDDGSTDGLSSVLRTWSDHWPQLRVIRCDQNRGKGAALRRGLLATSGQQVLCADADGATPIEEERALRQAIDRGADIAVGSRLVSAAHVDRYRQKSRRFAGSLYAMLVRGVLPVDVMDPQCGFKMFRLEAAQRIALLAEENGFAFDGEALAIASYAGYVVAEIGINWVEVPGSKVRLLRDASQMLVALYRIRRRLLAKQKRGDFRTPPVRLPISMTTSRKSYSHRER